MAVTVNWNCNRTCSVLSVHYEFTTNYSAPGAVGTVPYVMLAPLYADNSFPNGFHSVGIITADILAVWGSLNAQVKLEATGSQADVANPAVFTVSGLQLRVSYGCVDPVSGLPVKTMELILVPGGGGHEQCIAGSGLQSEISGGGGSAVGLQYRSAPLASCTSVTLNMGGFGGAPPNPSSPTPPGGLQCLCASGGVPPYTHHVTQGFAPLGQTLDPNTGCLTGTATGPGSPITRYESTDSNGDSGHVDVPWGGFPGGGAAPTSILLVPQTFAVTPLPDPTKGCK